MALGLRRFSEVEEGLGYRSVLDNVLVKNAAVASTSLSHLKLPQPPSTPTHEITPG